MIYYTVNKIGDGSRKNAFRADCTISHVWNPQHPCPTCNTYIVAVTDEMEETETRRLIKDLESACIRRGLIYEDVLTWYVRF